MRPEGKIFFLGAKEMGLTCLRFLLEHYSANLALIYGAHTSLAVKMSGFCSFDEVMAHRKVDYRSILDINSAQCEEEISAHAPDLMVQVGWSQIISDRILSLPRLGCVGFHSSLLPKDRGGSPVNWALIRGAKEWGTTLFYLEPGIDNGDIIGQAKFPLAPEDTCKTAYDKSTRAMVQLLKEFLPRILAGTAPRTRQNEHEATYNKRRKPGDGLIDWNRSSREIYDWVRALTHPYPGAFSHLHGRKLLIWKASLASATCVGDGLSAVRPGEIHSSNGEGVMVRTKDGLIRLDIVEEEGGKPIAATACASLRSNECFSNSSSS